MFDEITSIKQNINPISCEINPALINFIVADITVK